MVFTANWDPNLVVVGFECDCALGKIPNDLGQQFGGDQHRSITSTGHRCCGDDGEIQIAAGDTQLVSGQDEVQTHECLTS